MQLSDKLKDISLFKSLNESEIELLESISQVKNYSVGSIIFYEKEKLEYIYFLLSGEVKLYKVDRFENEIFLNSLKEKSFIYTVSNLCHNMDNKRVFYSVEATKECQVLKINAKKFKNLFMTKHEIVKAVLEESYNSILQLQFIVNRDIIFDGMAKVAYMISNDLDTFNNKKKHEVAYSLHLQPETLSRILKKLVRIGLIEMNKGEVKVKNIEALREIYD